MITNECDSDVTVISSMNEGSGQRQGDGEPRLPADFAGDINLAAMPIDDMLDDG